MDSRICLKVFNDPIHGSIQIPQYCQYIIDTPEFQRLRFIKQLATTCYVFPGAVHTRFDHSIGVCHLAGVLAKALQQSEGGILSNEVACVEIAGLCHDLGHGPFSHVFEDIASPDAQGRKWTHEEQSVVLFEYLIDKNHLKEKLANFDIYDQELAFICELILGRSRQPDKKLMRENKFYLYQIVNNSVNGVDVDKWDYFARDTHFLGMRSAFIFQRIVPFVRVFEVERNGVSRMELCYRDKVASDLNHMFLTRRRLHYTAYQHRVTKIIAIMLKDALVAAADHITFLGTNDKEFNLLEAVKDPKAFCQVNDTVINEIMRSRSTAPGMMKAREIIDRIHRRQLYQCLIEIQHANETMETVDPVKIKQCVVSDDDLQLSISSREDAIWLQENVEIEISCFDYGKGDENPLLDVPFFKKSTVSGETRASFLPQDKLPADLPQRLKDVTVRIYTRVPGLDRSSIKAARKYFYMKALRTLFRRGPHDPPGTPTKSSYSSFSSVPGRYGDSPPIWIHGQPATSPPTVAVSPIQTSDASDMSSEMISPDFDASSPQFMRGARGLISSPAASCGESTPTVMTMGAAAGTVMDAPRTLSSRDEPEAKVTMGVKKKLFND